MTVSVIDVLEMIDIEHQAYQAAGVAAGSREFLDQSHLEIPAVIPARQDIRKSAAQKSRTIDNIFERK